MIKIFKSISAFSVIAAVSLFIILQLSGCGGSKNDPTPSAQDAVKAKLIASKWNLQTVLVDGVDKTATYSGLSVSLTASNYTSTNGKALWPASGTWSFVDAAGKSIKRDDGIEMSVDVSDTSLKLSFTWTKNTLGGGRAASVSGQHVLTFGK